MTSELITAYGAPRTIVGETARASRLVMSRCRAKTLIGEVAFSYLAVTFCGTADAARVP